MPMNSRAPHNWLPWLALSLLTVLVCMTKYADYDLWWHLKLGESIVRDGRILWTDTFSFTVSGQPQFSGEWLGDALIYTVFAAGGFWGLNLFKAAVILLVFGCLHGTIRIRLGGDNGWWLSSFLALVAVLFAIRFRLFVRPYLFSILFSALFLLLIERWRGGRRDRIIWLLPAVMLAWANMSVGAVFGVVMLALAFVVELFETRSARLLPVLALTVAVSLFNPETWRLYLLALDLTVDPYRELVGEYQPITREILWGSGLRYTFWFQVLAAGSLVSFFLRKESRNLFVVGLFLFFLYESFRQVRLIELFSIIAAPLFASVLSSAISPLERLLPGRFAIRTALPVLLVAIIIPGAIWGSTVYTFGAGPKEGAFPEGAIRFMEQHNIRGRMFNSYGYGGYLAWRAPERKVFIDGRYRRVYTPAQYGEYAESIKSHQAWKAAEVKYGFDYALVEYDFRSRRFPLHLLDNPDWALVYWDNASTLFVKRTPERAQLIENFSYRIAEPRFLDFSYLDRQMKNGMLATALGRMDHDLALNPDNQFVVLARTYLLYGAGPRAYPLMEQELARIMPMKPDFAMKHSAYAIVLAGLGRKEQAAEQVRRALKMDAMDPAALSMAKELGIKVSVPRNTIPGHP